VRRPTQSLTLEKGKVEPEEKMREVLHAKSTPRKVSYLNHEGVKKVSIRKGNNEFPSDRRDFNITMISLKNKREEGNQTIIYYRDSLTLGPRSLVECWRENGSIAYGRKYNQEKSPDGSVFQPTCCPSHFSVNQCLLLPRMIPVSTDVKRRS